MPLPVRQAIEATAGHIVAWRKLRGLTQAQVAERAGVGRTTVVRVEAGDGGVSIETLMRILRTVGALDALPAALDPYATDMGRLRAEEQLPDRVRPRKFAGD